MNQVIARILRAPRSVTIIGLVLLTILAWVWLAAGAGMQQGAHFSLAPFISVNSEAGMMMEPGMAMPSWSLQNLALAFSMWWVMMIAMMLPAAAPVVLLYDRSYRSSYSVARAPVWQFVAGYLLVWGAFSLVAGVAQIALGQAALLTKQIMTLNTPALSGVILLAAGIYQLTTFKHACLERCRNPAQFIARFHSPGPVGAFRLGLIHGIYCLGCCWILMLLLFVGGVMNLVWVAILTLAVAAEKLLPQGKRIAQLIGAAFILWGAWLLVPVHIQM